MASLSTKYGPTPKELANAAGPAEDAYHAWKANPTPEGLKGVVDIVQPTIEQAVRAYAPNASPVVRDRAQLMAAKAIQGYSPAYGANLHTHVYRQLQTLQRMAPQLHDPMPLPEQLRVDRGRVFGAVEQVTNDLGREPSDEEVAELAKLPLKRVIKVRQMMRAGLPQSVIEERGEDDEDAPDLIAHETTPRDDWHDAVYHDLGDMDRVVMMHRSGYRKAPILTNQEIAKKLNITPSAVTQRAARIQAKLDQFE